MNEILNALADGCADCSQTLRRGKGKVHCPLHSDSTPSLDIQQGDDGTVLLFCHSCRDSAGIIAHLRDRGLWADAKVTAAVTTASRQIDAVYDYEGFQVVRYSPKSFVQRRRVGDAWVYDLDGVERVLYHRAEVLTAVSENRTVFIPEGERDVETLRHLELVATCNPGGAGKWLDRFSLDLVNADVVVLVDADDPGRKHAREVAQSIGLAAKSLKVVELPQKDVTEFMVSGTKEQLLAIIEKAPAWDNDGRRILTGKDLASMYEDVVARRMAGDPDYVGIPTGIAPLDKYVEYRPGDLWLVVAATGVGKSAMLSTMQMDLDARGIGSLFVSLEMSWIVIVERMLLAGVTLDQLRERAGLLVDEPALSIEKLETLAKVAKMRGARILFVDYAQRMAATQDSEYERVSSISNGLARIARETRMTIVAAAQVSRAGSSRDGQPPRLSEIRASGHLEQDAAVILSLGRKSGASSTIVRIEKNRHGKCDQINLEFEPRFGRFVTEKATPSEPESNEIPF